MKNKSESENRPEILCAFENKSKMCDIESESVQKPSQRKCKTILLIKTIFHAVYFILNNCVSTFGAIMCFNITDEQAKDERIDTIKKYVFGYGTNWNYLFQTTFLFLALAHDILEWASKQDSHIASVIRYWRDVIFAGLVVPYTCFVFCMFWSLYAIDRELVFPKVYDVVVPWWFNHCVHTNILAMVAIEMVLQPRRHPTNRKLELTLDGVVGVAYAIVYYSIYFFAGRWLYNVFGIMTWWQVCLFQLLIWTSSYVFYEIQWPISRLIHGQELELQKEEQKTAENSLEQNRETQNGEAKLMSETKDLNGDTKLNGDCKTNGDTASVDFKTPPFSTKSWSLKYRSLRSQFENSKL